MDIIDILALAQLQELIYNASKDAQRGERVANNPLAFC